MLAHALLSLLVFNHGVMQIRFGLFELFCFCFMSNKYYLMPLNFRRYVLSEWNLINTKVKGFMKVSHVSWNVPETVFHEMLGKKSFTVYPCLKNTFFYRTPPAAASVCCWFWSQVILKINYEWSNLPHI